MPVPAGRSSRAQPRCRQRAGTFDGRRCSMYGPCASQLPNRSSSPIVNASNRANTRPGGQGWGGRATCADLVQKRPCAGDSGAQRVQPSPQLRIGSVDQRPRRIRQCCDQLHDPVVRAIPAAMPRVNDGEAIWPRRHVGRSGAVEHDRPCASTAPRQRSDVGEQPVRGLGAVAPPAVRTRPHHVVAVHDHRARHRPDCAAISRAEKHAVTRQTVVREARRLTPSR